jgi:hypothetical protein
MNGDYRARKQALGKKSLGYAKNEAEGLLHWSQLIAPEELERFRGCFCCQEAPNTFRP